MKRFYFIPNTYSAQIEGGGFNFRIGYTCIGLRIIPIKYWRGRAKDIPFLYKILIPISIGINYHSSQANQINRFRIEIGCFTFGYLSKGERTEKSEYGFHLSFCYNWKNHPTRQNYYKLI